MTMTPQDYEEDMEKLKEELEFNVNQNGMLMNKCLLLGNENKKLKEQQHKAYMVFDFLRSREPSLLFTDNEIECIDDWLSDYKKSDR